MLTYALRRARAVVDIDLRRRLGVHPPFRDPCRWPTQGVPSASPTHLRSSPGRPTFSLATAVILTLGAFVRMTLCPAVSICFTPIFFGPLLNSLLQIRQHILDLL